MSDKSIILLDLGRSRTLFDIPDSEGTTVFWLSYWKDLKGLQAFATSSAHRLGQDQYNAKKFPHVGVMHETYHAPRGSWEAIYDNLPPLGLGALNSLALYHPLRRLLTADEIHRWSEVRCRGKPQRIGLWRDARAKREKVNDVQSDGEDSLRQLLISLFLMWHFNCFISYIDLSYPQFAYKCLGNSFIQA